MFERPFAAENEDEQATITAWFEETYRRQGFDYLRPLSAYAVYITALELRPSHRLLDVACGPGLLLKQAVMVGANAYGVDLSYTAIRMASQVVPKATTKVGNAEQLPFKDGQMDAVACLGGLERMLNVPQVLAEMKRVSSPNAKFCFLVRNSQTLFWRLFMRRLGMKNQAGHQGAKSLSEWEALFVENGFRINQVLPDQYPIWRWRTLLTLGLTAPDPALIRQSWLPLSYADEFIFLLSKSDDA